MQLNSKGVLAILVALALLATRCKQTNESTTIEQEQPISNSLPEDFLQFYDKFQLDSAYQLDHIVFPLEGKTYDENNGATKKSWTAENWVIHKAFDDMEGTFTRSYTEFGGIIIEKIVDNQGLLTMERRFSKMGDDDWHLIFYDPLHLSQN